MLRNLLPSVWRRNEETLLRREEEPFFSIQREIDQIFDDVLQRFDRSSLLGDDTFKTFNPTVDVREDEKEVTIKAELPGLDEKDLDVTLADGVVTIKGEKKEEKEDEKDGYWHRETRYGTFRRVITVPEGIDREKVEARFKNGVLTITVPRSEEAKEKVKKIAITAA